MTVKETTELLARIRAMYPNEKQLSAEELKFKIEMWADALKCVTYAQILEAFKAYYTTMDTGFAPQVGQLLNYIRHKNKLSETEIKIALQRALCDSTYHAEEQFERLPDDLKRIIGTPAELRRQAMRENDDSKIFIAQVCKEYRARVDGGTLDYTMLTTAEDKARIGQTMARLAAEVADNG